MAEFKILGFNHTSFTVSDLDRTIRFFVEACGFELLTRGPRDAGLLEKMTAIPGADVEIAFVQGPGHRLELIEYKGPADRAVIQSRLCDTGSAHIGLDVDDIEAAVRLPVITGSVSPARSSRLTMGRMQGGVWPTRGIRTASRLNICRRPAAGRNDPHFANDFDR